MNSVVLDLPAARPVSWVMLLRAQRQFQSGLQLKKRDRPVFKIFTDDAFGFQAETIAIKVHCSFKVINTECDQCDAGFHEVNPGPAARQCRFFYRLARGQSSLGDLPLW